MKIALVGSRNLIIDDNTLEKYLAYATEIVSGGAKGIDTCAAKYAITRGIKLTEILPQYNIYGRAAPIKRNIEIVNYTDSLVFFWDGKSKGTLSVINYAKKLTNLVKLLK